MVNTKAFAVWLRARRKEVKPKLTQSALAAEAGCVPYYVSRLESNGSPNCTAPIHEPGVEKVDALARVLERYLARPLVNEARRVLGYSELAEEPTPSERSALQIPDVDENDEVGAREELTLWLLRQPRERRRYMSRVIAELDGRVRQPLAMAA